jgi:hypothetical protein
VGGWGFFFLNLAKIKNKSSQETLEKLRKFSDAIVLPSLNIKFPVELFAFQLYLQSIPSYNRIRRDAYQQGGNILEGL